MPYIYENDGILGHDEVLHQIAPGCTFLISVPAMDIADVPTFFVEDYCWLYFYGQFQGQLFEIVPGSFTGGNIGIGQLKYDFDALAKQAHLYGIELATAPSRNLVGSRPVVVDGRIPPAIIRQIYGARSEEELIRKIADQQAILTELRKLRLATDEECAAAQASLVELYANMRWNGYQPDAVRWMQLWGGRDIKLNDWIDGLVASGSRWGWAAPGIADHFRGLIWQGLMPVKTPDGVLLYLRRHPSVRFENIDHFGLWS